MTVQNGMGWLERFRRMDDRFLGVSGDHRGRHVAAIAVLILLSTAMIIRAVISSEDEWELKAARAVPWLFVLLICYVWAAFRPWRRRR